MESPAVIVSYLAALERALPFRGAVAERISSEVREHLLDAAASARAEGLGVDDALASAVARFGPAEVVAARFAAELRAPRFASVVCASVGLFFAAFAAVLWMIYPDPGTGTMVPLALAAAAIAATARPYVADRAGWFVRAPGLLGWRSARPAGTVLLVVAASTVVALTTYEGYLASLRPRFVLSSVAFSAVFYALLVGSLLVHIVHATAGPLGSRRAPR
jgi:hypothetical protein